jgi:thiol-disulfide isomerase/thioredoxin
MTAWKYLKPLAGIGIIAVLSIVIYSPMAAGTFTRDSLKAGSEAPVFVMRNLLTDSAVFLRDYTGKTLREPWKNKNRHVIVLSFWATWCQPCKIEIPLLEKISEKMKTEPVKFFLINTMEKSESNEDSVRQEYGSRGYKLPCLLDQAARFAQLYTVHGLPMMVVIDKFGIVRKINRGYAENFNIELEKLLRELVKEDGSKKK